jgi:hypothetical protein
VVPEREFSFSPDLPGDSHLAIAPPALKWRDGSTQAQPIAIKLYATTEDGEIVFTGRPNERGFLGRLEAELTAQSILDAEQKGYRALSPSLSNWSAQLDIPLDVWRAHVTEVATGNTSITVINPFDEVALALGGAGKLGPEYRAFVGFYREALQSNSAAYRFLCLFKIAEGIRKRRQRAATEAIARKEKPMRLPSERVPQDPTAFPVWLNGIYPRREWDEMTIGSVFVPIACGRKINDLLDHELLDLRNDLAHALSDTTKTVALSVDEALHIARVETWLPLLRCVVRRMMKNEFPESFLSHLAEDGTIIGAPKSARGQEDK